MDKALFIYGPTAVGKSDMAIDLAKKFSGEVISCDSVQVFRGFDIGSAKVTKKEMSGVIHRNIDICNGNDEFSAGDYAQRTKTLIKEINSRGALPIIVGGTGLYIDALLGGYNFGDIEKNEKLRKDIERQLAAEGADNVYLKLEKLNPELAHRTDKRNSRRLVRAMELALIGQAQTKGAPEFEYKLFALTLPRQELYARINLRVDKMIKRGLVEEVKGLLKAGISPQSQGMRAIGYKEVALMLSGAITPEKMAELIKQHSRNYAKRQMTFMRGLEKKYECKEVYAQNYSLALKEIENEVKQWKRKA